MMKTQVLTNSSQVSVEWLNKVLIRSGSLKSGNVVNFKIIETNSTNGINARLKLDYSKDAFGVLPKKLFLKMCSTENSSTGYAFGDSETSYYNKDYLDLEDGPVATTFDIQYCPEQCAYHLLMQDYSDSHYHAWDLEPTPEYCHLLARAMAKLHAHHAQTNFSVQASFTSATQWDTYFDHVLSGLEPLLSEISNEKVKSWSNILKDVARVLPQLMRKRCEKPIGQTIIHGDLNPGNILVPKDLDNKIYLIDRQPFEWSLTTWLGVSDIAYAIVLWWETEKRRALELAFLQNYRKYMLEYNVTDYSWDNLYEDYQISVIQCLFIPIEWCVLESDRKSMKWVWLPQLEKAIAAFLDLNCSKLLQE